MAQHASPDTTQEAREILLKIASDWQSIAYRHYKDAAFQREQYLNGCAGNSMMYEYYMALAGISYRQARIILLALA